jgi:hypothetical protein
MLQYTVVAVTVSAGSSTTTTNTTGSSGGGGSSSSGGGSSSSSKLKSTYKFIQLPCYYMEQKQFHMTKFSCFFEYVQVLPYIMSGTSNQWQQCHLNCKSLSVQDALSD